MLNDATSTGIDTLSLQDALPSFYGTPGTRGPRLIARPGDIDAEDRRGRGPRYRNRVWAEYYRVGRVYRASPHASDPDHGR